MSVTTVLTMAIVINPRSATLETKRRKTYCRHECVVHYHFNHNVNPEVVEA